ncbi:MAG: MBL fold metallo-hydrolase [Parabacteroides johnsonii]
MEISNNQIIMLGTGNAIATQCYNTCFILKMAKTMLLVDAGGGNGILVQLEKAKINISDIHDMFITHAHTDHILGAVWMVRAVIHRMKDKEYKGSFTVYSHDKALKVLDWICRMTLPKIDLSFLGKSVFFHELQDKDIFNINNVDFQCFDILSTKEKQFGFCTQMSNGTKLVCLGDEPYNEANRHYVEGADWLLCEAFCLYKDRHVFKPYEKHHSTALEAGLLAEKLNVKNLLLYHTEDKNLSTRKKNYMEESLLNFKGKVCVPDDLEEINIDE